jgi:predicted nucleic acid-binding protein
MLIKHPLFPHAVNTATLVLDVSVALRWVVQALATPYSNGVMAAMVRETAAVPACWLIALTDAVNGAEHSGLITPPVTAAKFATLCKYPIWFDDETDPRLWRDIFPLARTHNLSVFDAAYLELALRLKLPLATTDPALSRAANTAGATGFTA